MRSIVLATSVSTLALLLTVPQTASAAPTSITGCRTLSASGSYILSRSFTAFPAQCIIVAADHVKIDLDGQTLSGLDGSLGGLQEAITDDGTARIGVEVTNGSITGFRRAVELGQCNGCKISWLRLTGNGDGINIGKSALIHHNVVLDTGDDGIHATREALIHDNISNGSLTGDGISAQKNSIVRGNVAQGNGAAGFRLQCPALVLENVAAQNSPNYTDNGGCELDDNVGF